MPCENTKWGFWTNGNFRGKKYPKINPNPNNKRAKLIIDGEWFGSKDGKKYCRKWTTEEINSGYGITKKYGKVKLIPIKCNHCSQCRLQNANEWVTRILCEYKTAGKKGCKIDLTYNKENVPDGYVINYAHQQSWIKRLRQHLKRHNPEYKGFTYYIGLEYGPKGGRPHGHIIIIGWEPTDQVFWKLSNTGYPMYRSETIDKTWGKGYCTVEPLTPETVSYATRYTHKKSGEEKTNKGVPEQQHQSQGIGKKYWELYKEEIINDTGIWIKTKNKAKLVKIPRYFRKKWQNENPLQYETFIDWEMKQQEKQKEAELKQTDKTILQLLKDKVETSKIIYNMLKRQNLDIQSQIHEANENIKETLKKRLTG